MSLVAHVTYNEGASNSPNIQLVVGFLPASGAMLLAISRSGLLGFIRPLKIKVLDRLKTGLQLNISGGASIAWGSTPKKYVVVGGNTSIAYSSNGAIWHNAKNPSSQGLHKVLWNERLTQFISIGKGGVILVSKNGIDWELIKFNSQMNLNDVLWCPKNRQYLLIGDAGFIALSKDGFNWRTQASPVRSNLIAMAGSGQWDDKLLYVVITQNDEILESKDGIIWQIFVHKNLRAQGFKTVYYDHSYGGGIRKDKGIYKYFSILSSSYNRSRLGLDRPYKYFNHGTVDNPKYSYSSPWYANYIYLRDYYDIDVPRITEVRRVEWFDELKLYVAVALNPPVFYNNEINPYIFDRVMVESDFINYNGFDDITYGQIPEFKDDETTIYYDLNTYS